MNNQFKEDATETLVFYPKEQLASSAATVALYKPGGSVLQSAAAATVSAVSTTIAAAVEQGARLFTVASATGITKGRRYLVQEGGRTWDVEVRDISGTTVYCYGSAPFALTTSATVKGWCLSYSLTATHTAERDNNYRALWTYTIGGTDYTANSYFDVVKTDEYFTTTLAYVLAAYDWLLSLIDDDDLDGQELLRAAWRQWVVPRLQSKGMEIHKIKDLDQLRPYHAACVNEHVAYNQAMRDVDKMEAHEMAKERSAELLNLITPKVSWYDDNDDLLATDDEEKVSFRESRLVR